MRTTLDLDEDVLEAVKLLAATDSKSVGEVVSALVRQAMEARMAIHWEHGIPVFAVPGDARPFSLEDIRREDAEW